LGEESFEKGNLEEAASHYRKILEMNPEDFDSHEKLVNAYIKLKDDAKAVEQTLELLEKLASAGQAEAALTFGGKVRKLIGDETDLVQAIASLHLEVGDNIQALIDYETAAETLLDREDFRRAIVIYERMLDIDDENIDAHFKVAGAFTKIGETNKAVACYKALADTLTSSGVLEDSINWQFLINVYENIVAIDPTHIMAREWLVDAYISKKDEEKALENLTGLLEALGEEGDPQKRIEALKKFIELKPEDYRSRRVLARLYKKTNLHEDAISEFGEMAHLAVEKGDFDVGLRAFREILTIDSFDTETVVGIGKIYEIAGRYPEAALEFRRAAHLYAAAAKFDKASRYYIHAAENDPAQVGALLEAADLERQGGNTSKALELLQDFMQKSLQGKNFGLAKYACNMILTLKGADPSARKVLGKLKDLPDISFDEP